MIEVKQISKSFGTTKAVNNISFKVEKGETLVLLGASGCGKTTTLKMINKLIQPNSGNIFINGRNVDEVAETQLRLGIGYVLQNHGLFPHFTVAQNIAIVPKLLKWTAIAIEKRTDELLTKLHLPLTIKNNYPSELSGGQQQRVGLARALMANPPVLLMDEPLGALDPITRASIRKEFLNLDELQNKTIVMVTHDIEEAFELGDKICLMDNGEILQMGTPVDLLRNPKNELVREFFKSQKLQLSLKTTELKSLAPFLTITTEDKNLSLEGDHLSVWETLELLSDSPSIVLKINGDNVKLSNSILMDALEKLKNGATI